MTSPQEQRDRAGVRGIRWWPGILIFLLAFGSVVFVRVQSDWAFQERNLFVVRIVIIAAMLLQVWWTFFSRAPRRLRISLTCAPLVVLVAGIVLFRVRGMTGDLLPILEFRWTKRESLPVAKITSGPMLQRPDASTNAAFPQFLGPDRNGILPGPRLETNWTLHPPQILWRQKVGAAWSGFAIVGNVALTQEQRGEDECVVAYELASGKQIWQHTDRAGYNTIIAGEGPRAVPTVASNRIFTFGATGILNCLDPATGRVIWTRDVIKEGGGKVRQWGCSSSPLVVNGLVIVHGGQEAPRSLLAFDLEDGKRVWLGGNRDSGHASPSLATLAGSPQVLAFNHGSISAHEPTTGAMLWERSWGEGDVVSTPVIVSSNRVLFSSGYGVGAELLEISRDTTGKCFVQLVWKSIRMKSKFAHMFARDGFLYGLDDGIFACVDLKDGSQRWKEGRYGHGQGLLVGELYLLMAESGELVLLRLTPDAPNELARFRVFNSKTWNPIALSGDRLLVRNDQEAACLRLKLAP